MKWNKKSTNSSSASNPSKVGYYLHTSGACIAFENLFACLVISSCSALGKDANWSYFVPINTGIAVLLNPRACRYHSLTLLRVDFRVRSNMNRMATASLETRGSIDTNSLWPPKSHICGSSVRERKIKRQVYAYWEGDLCISYADGLFHKVDTQCLYIILAELHRLDTV